MPGVLVQIQATSNLKHMVVMAHRRRGLQYHYDGWLTKALDLASLLSQVAGMKPVRRPFRIEQRRQLF